MNNDNLHPIHLQPFMDGTALALERLRNAWLGLSFADRAYLISVLLSGTGGHPNALSWKRHHGALLDLALADENAYIRYLAAQQTDGPEKSDDSLTVARLEKINSDSSQLVRSAQVEVGCISPALKVQKSGGHPHADMFNNYDPSSFWASSPVYRLAVAAANDIRFSVTELIRYAAKELLPNGTVTVDEMFDVLLQDLGPDYVTRLTNKKPRPRRSYSHLSNEVEGFWRLIPDIPKGLSYILLRCLPGGSKSFPIPPGVLDSLDDDQLAWLLWRDDIELKELRRKLYMESQSDKLRPAIVGSVKFDLLDSDLTSLVSATHGPKESKEKSIKELMVLAEFCHSASLVQMEAVNYILRYLDHYSYRREHDDVQSDRVKRLWNGGLGRASLEQEILQLRVFELAKVLSPLGIDEEPGKLPDTLKVHHSPIALQNPWQTYLNLWQAVRPEEWNQQLNDLPTVWVRDCPLPD
jgi:hypothetical protein